MFRLAIAAVIVAGLSACQGWDGRDTGRYSGYGYPRYGYAYPFYPFYGVPFGFDRRLAHERRHAEEHRRRAALHDRERPESPARRGGGGLERQRPGVKQPFDTDAAPARRQAARQQAIEAERLRKQGLPPAARTRRDGQAARQQAIEAERLRKRGLPLQ